MTIVVGYVPTPEGEAALTAAIAEARLREQPLHIVNSARGDSLIDSRFVQESGIEDLRSRLDASGVVYEIDQKVRGHEASEEVVEAADRVKASLIVIGLRRRTPTGKLITGSQAQRILLDANCPVLAVKAGNP
jgi:nucleotide-binding universal stress UspA family protein